MILPSVSKSYPLFSFRKIRVKIPEMTPEKVTSVTSFPLGKPVPVDAEHWRDAKIVAKEAARILFENRHLSWYQALRRARIALGMPAENDT